MIGYEPSQFRDVGYEAFTALLHHDDYERAMQAMRDYLSGSAIMYQVDYRIKRRDGSYTWYIDRGYAVEKHPDGSPRVLRGLVFDLGAEIAEGAYDEAIFQGLRSVIPEAARTGATHDRRLVTICSVCLRVDIPDKGWFELSKDLPEIIPEHISHGICPDCIHTMYPEYERTKGEKES